MTTNIVVLKDLEHVRSRHTMYIDSVDHAAKEVIDNVIDEFQAGACSFLGIDLDTKTNTMTIADNGRGIPTALNATEGLSTFAVVFTKLHSSGKYDNRAENQYAHTIGLNGVGVKITSATSELFEAWVKKGRTTYKVAVERGVLRRAKNEPIAGVIEEELPKLPFQEPGLVTVLRFTPDPTVFGKKYAALDPEYFEDLCHNLQFLCPGLKIELIVNGKRTSLKNTVGIKGIILEKCKANGDKETSECEEFTVQAPKLDLSMWWNQKAEDELILSYVNCQRTKDEGKHVDGLRKAITKAFGDEGKALNRFLREGLRCAFHVKIDNPMFQGQNKHRLLNPEADDEVQEAVWKHLQTFLGKNKELRDSILERAEALQEASESYKKDREALKALNKTRSKTFCLPEKLITAPNCAPEKRELYVCEGDSAAGPIIKARTVPLFQEVYKLKGKITNAGKAEMAALLGNEDVKGLIQSVGCGIADDCKPDKARVGRVILMTDADSDGHHINALIITLFAKYMPKWIDAGKLFVLQSPLFMASHKEHHWYGLGDSETKAKANLMATVPEKYHDKIIINRFKGHGAASSDEIFEYAMGPKRQLIQVKLPTGDEELVFSYMGNDVQVRRELLGIE